MAAPQPFTSISRRPPDVEDYIDILRRYRSWIIGPTFAGLVLAVVVAFWLPDVYVSSASMQIRPGSVPASMLPMQMSNMMQQRLQQLQYDILSRDTLIHLIKEPKLDLYKKERARYSDEDVAEMYFHKKIHISSYSADGEASRGAQAFRISFEYPDKNKARDVVASLVGLFTSHNVQFQEKQATTAGNFLESEVKAAKEKYDSAQATVAAFSSENQGKLPENFQQNMMEVQARNAAINMANEAISQERQRQALLDSNLKNNKAQQIQAEANLYKSVTVNNQQATNQSLVFLEQQIATQNLALEVARKKYQEDFPDVTVIKEGIKSLEKRRDELASAGSGSANPGATVRQVADPQVQQTLADLKKEENSIVGSIQASKLAETAKEQQLVMLNRLLKEATDKVSASPIVIQRYNQLTQELAMAKDAYEKTSRNQEASATQKNMEAQQAGETLETLEQPMTPETPTDPKRGAIVGIGTVAGLALGIALAGAKEIKNTSLKNLKDVRAYTNLPVLSSIPLLENALLVRRKRRLAWLAWSTALIIGSVMMSSAVYYYYVVGRQAS